MTDKDSEFSKTTKDLTNGCGCMCHLGVGTKTMCEHCQSQTDKDEMRKMVTKHLNRIWEVGQNNAYTAEGVNWEIDMTTDKILALFTRQRDEVLDEFRNELLKRHRDKNFILSRIDIYEIRN